MRSGQTAWYKQQAVKFNLKNTFRIDILVTSVTIFYCWFFRLIASIIQVYWLLADGKINAFFQVFHLRVDFDIHSGI